MHIAFHGGHKYPALCFTERRIVPFLFFHIRKQVSHGLFHYPGTLYHLWKEHLSCTEQISHNIHPGHQWTFDHQYRPSVLLPRLLGVLFDVGVEETVGLKRGACFIIGGGGGNRTGQLQRGVGAVAGGLGRRTSLPPASETTSATASRSIPGSSVDPEPSAVPSKYRSSDGT